LEVNERLETSVFDADFKSSPFKKNNATRGPSYAKYLAGRARGSSLKKVEPADDINCLSNFLKDQILVMNDSMDKRSFDKGSDMNGT
jgi:hypothetical protein